MVRSWNRVIVAVLLAVLPTSAWAGVKGKMARETAEYMARALGREAVPEGAEVLARKLEGLAVRHGDDVFAAARKAGPRMVRIVEEAGAHGGPVVKLLARHGDEALWVVAHPDRLALFVKHGDGAATALMKHKGIAEPLVRAHQVPGVQALNAVSPRCGRRLAMLQESGDLERIGRSPELLDVIGRHGDRAMDFIWKHKGALTVSAVLASFLADPEPYLNGSRQLAEHATEAVAEAAVKPLAELPGKVAAEVTGRSPGWFLVLAGLCAAALAAWVLIGRLGGLRKQRPSQSTE